MAETAVELVAPLFDAVNARDEATLEVLCDERCEVVMLPADTAARTGPYCGHSGLRELLVDTEAQWEELRLTATEVVARDDLMLVSGRIHARSRELGVRDLPTAWVLRVRDGRVASAHVYEDVDTAVAAAGDGWAAMQSGGA